MTGQESPALTPEECAEFAERLEAAMKDGKYTVLPPPPRFLTEDQISQLLAECVTVVKPGETLVIRMGREWTPSQMREVQDALDEIVRWRELPFRAIVVPGDGLGAIEAPEPGDG